MMLRSLPTFILSSSSALLVLLLLQAYNKNITGALASHPPDQDPKVQQEIVKYTAGKDQKTFGWEQKATTFKVIIEEASGTGYIWTLSEPLPACITAIKEVENLPSKTHPGNIGGPSRTLVYRFTRDATSCSSSSSYSCSHTILLEMRHSWQSQSVTPVQTITITRDGYIDLPLSGDADDNNQLSFEWSQTSVSTLVVNAHEDSTTGYVWTIWPSSDAPSCVSHEHVVDLVSDRPPPTPPANSTRCHTFTFTKAECHHDIVLDLRNDLPSPSATPRRTAHISVKDA
eukprot:GHVS01039924.1.p1 GENE.GHVS01039924.1~~GHVS01039924.1.p1  ORF type:complete len:286 (+),score=42.50 GHVS01039924.1:158-1015(+)